MEDKSFIERFHDLFPNYVELGGGYELIGRYINDNRTVFHADEILSALANSNQSDLLERAERALAIDNIWKEWCDIYRTNTRTR